MAQVSIGGDPNGTHFVDFRLETAADVPYLMPLAKTV
jgi:hypothetical protein